MDGILIIETYLVFVEQLEQIERYIPDDDYNHGTKDKKNEIAEDTDKKIISLFSDYITWLIMETGMLQHKLYIRKSYELLWKPVNFYSIDYILVHKVRGRFWQEYCKKYDEISKK